MVVPTAFGMNLTKLYNITPFNINLTLTEPKNIMNQITDQANYYTGGYLGLVIMISLVILIYWILTDKSGLSGFTYNDFRALAISLGISFIYGLTMIEIGLITNLKHIALIGVLYIATVIFILVIENQE